MRCGVYGKIGIMWCLKTVFQILNYINSALVKLGNFIFVSARSIKINQVSSKISILVKWNKPSIGWHKLNTDDASIGNPGKAGGGGVIRDCHGV